MRMGGQEGSMQAWPSTNKTRRQTALHLPPRPQELYDEYFAALARPGTPLKTFRISIYALPAMLTGLEAVYEVAPDHHAEDMEAR